MAGNGNKGGGASGFVPGLVLGAIIGAVTAFVALEVLGTKSFEIDPNAITASDSTDRSEDPTIPVDQDEAEKAARDALDQAADAGESAADSLEDAANDAAELIPPAEESDG